MKTMTQLDEMDRKIIELLQRDASQTNTDIAKQLETSEATVRRRRTRLQEEDIIHVVTAINPFVLGYKFIVIMGLGVTPGMLSEVEAQLCALPDVRLLGVTFGRYDLVLEAWFKSNEDLLDFVSVSLGGTHGVTRTETFQIVRLSKYSFDWKPPAAPDLILVQATTEPNRN